MLPILFEPTYDPVAINDALGTEGFVIVKIRDTGHRYGFTDNRSEDVSAGAAAVDRHIMIRRLNGGANLAVASEVNMFR